MSTQHSKQTAQYSTSEAKRSITCIICGAVYAPSQEHENLLHAPSIALESVFMNMCHFCFRCRRPACPECWDDIHCVCGTCGLEAGLPFRIETTLWGDEASAALLTIPPTLMHSAPKPLVCIHAGSMFSASRSDIRASGQPIPTTSSEEQALPLFTEKEPQSIPDPQMSLSTAQVDIDEIATQPEHRARVRRHIERVLTILVASVLLLLILLITFAVSSEYANTLIATAIHIDIRAEIAYLWQLIRGIH